MSDSEEATLIWNEYQYRHEHCWKTIFKLTGSAVLLGVVPYLDANRPRVLGVWLISPPVLSVALIIFAMLRMRRELFRLRRVKAIHRKRQADLYNFPCDEAAGGTFETHVWGYLWILLALAAVNVMVAVGI
jgi:hypothetical protein